MKPTDDILANVPAALKEHPRWVTWKYVERDGKSTKCPVNAKTGGMADSTDPATWATFDVALAAYQADSLAGVGFVFAPDGDFCGVDLDDSIDPATGQLKVWARAIVERLNSYTEVSPSGHGVKIFLRARKPGSRCRKGYEDGDVEIYDADRFFTVTGRRMPDFSGDVEARQDELAAVYRDVFGENGQAASAAPPVPTGPSAPPAVRLTDDEILQKAQRGRRSGEKFTALWSGLWNNYFNSASEADLSVCCTLAFYTKDPVQIDRLFRQSRLVRGKWDEPRGESTYGRDTIGKALSTVTAQYTPRRRRSVAAPSSNGDAQSGNQAQQTDAQPAVPLGSRDPVTGRLVLSNKKTFPTAKAYVDEFHTHADGRTLLSYASLMMEWQGNRYVEAEDESLRHRLQPWLHEALQYVYNRQTGGYDLVPFDSNPGTMKAALDSIRAYAHIPASTTPPTWLSNAPGRPDAREVLPCKTVNLHIPTGQVFSATPALFTTNALEFDYDADAPAPQRWLQFLDELWGDDQEAINLLQEWLGYCLTADTAQQKMLLMVGPKRCGKGTIGRILTRLIGAGNITGPTTSSLAGPFGLQPLLGKSLAIVSDARFTGDHVPTVVERLLCISDEDALTVDRKFLGSVTMKLPTRFMFLTNELPRMNDVSGALAGRFLILKFTQSFFGREDLQLMGKLIPELPGILLWALQGWVRLHERGRFVQPASSESALLALEDLSSPVGAFVRDRCVVEAGQRIWVDDLYQAWKEWCDKNGRNVVTARQVFGRDLFAVAPGVTCRRNHVTGRYYEGISVKGGL